MMEAAVRHHQRARLSTTLTPAARDTCSPCPHLHMAYRRAWRSTWTHVGVHLSWECIYTCIEIVDGAFCAVVVAENVILHTCTRAQHVKHQHARDSVTQTVSTVKGHSKKSWWCWTKWVNMQMCGWKKNINCFSVPFASISLWITHANSFILSSQCRDRPEITRNHETDGLSEDRRSGEKCRLGHMVSLLYCRW